MKQFLTCLFTPLTAPATTSEDSGLLASCNRIELNRIVVDTPLPISNEPNPDVVLCGFFLRNQAATPISSSEREKALIKSGRHSANRTTRQSE